MNTSATARLPRGRPDLRATARITNDDCQTLAQFNEWIYAKFPTPQRECAALYSRLTRWPVMLTPDGLSQTLTYTSKVDGRTRSMAL